MVTINQQAFLFLTCVKTGIIMGVIYDLVRVLRKIIYHPNWLVQIEDLLYWVACGCFAFIMIYWRNYGQIRGFVFLGILIGTVLYFSTVSQLFVKIMTQIIMRFIIIPIRCIMVAISIPIKHILKLYNSINKKRKIHKSKYKMKWKRRRDHLYKQLKIIKAKK